MTVRSPTRPPDEAGQTERRVASNTLWLTVQPLALNLLSLVPMAYIARTLGASDFGRFNLGLAFVALFAPLTSLGLRPLTVRHMAREPAQARLYLGDQLVLRLVLAAATATLVIAGAALSGGKGETRQVIFIAALTLIPAAAASVLEDGLGAFELMRPVSVAGLVGGLSLTAASVVVIVLGGGIRELSLSYAVGPTVRLVVLWGWSVWHHLTPAFRFRWRSYPGLLREAFPFFAAGLVETATLRLDLLVLARVVGEASLGPYTAAMMLVEKASVLAHGASASLLPAVSRLKARDPERAIGLLRQATTWLLFITLPTSMLTAAYSGGIMGLIFGQEFVEGWPILAVGIWSLPAACLLIVQMQALYAADRQNLVLTTKTAAAVLSVPLLVVLITRLGALGGALIQLIRIALTLLLRLRRARADFPNAWPSRDVACLLATTVLMVLPLVVVFSPRLTLVAFVVGVLSSVLYLAVTALTGVVPVGAILRRAASCFR